MNKKLTNTVVWVSVVLVACALIYIGGCVTNKDTNKEIHSVTIE